MKAFFLQILTMFCDSLIVSICNYVLWEERAMLRYAIMGTNWLSHIYYHAIEAAGDQVIAVCSRSPERAESSVRARLLCIPIWMKC